MKLVGKVEENENFIEEIFRFWDKVILELKDVAFISKLTGEVLGYARV